MNTTILIIVAFALGLAFGGAFLGTCNTRAYEFEDNPSTNFRLQQMEREQKRLEQRQWEYNNQLREKRPCP